MKQVLLLLSTLFGIVAISYCQSNYQKNVVGEEVIISYENDHPYVGNTIDDNPILVSQQEVFQENASYIAVHFKKLELAEGDFLVIRDPDNKRRWQYDTREKRSSFWSIHIYGERLIIEIFSISRGGGYGYYIDKIAKGFSLSDSRSNFYESLCGPDDSEEAACFEYSEPDVFEKSTPVARLLINGTSSCTGWLLGSDGHIITNNHCVENAQEAQNVTVEFLAQGENCADDCRNWFDCPGIIEAVTTTIVKTSSNLDYSMLSLPSNVSSIYGYLQLRNSNIELGEQIYIPQHPQGWGKRISLESSHSSDFGNKSRVYSLNEPRCGGLGYDIGYFSDTQSGSSGSPVIGYQDNLVVALHHCGACPNRGVPIQEIIAHLGGDLPNNSIGESPHITGNNFLCTNDFYSINDIPESATITWSVYPLGTAYLTQVENGVFLSKIGSGLINLTAIINYGDHSKTITKEIFVGENHVDNILGQRILGCSPSEVFAQTSIPTTEILEYEWNVVGGMIHDSYNTTIVGQNLNSIVISPNDYVSSLIVKLKIKTICGWSSNFERTFSVNCGSLGRPPSMLSAFPNPSKGELSLKIDEYIYRDGFELQIFDSFGKLVYNKESIFCDFFEIPIKFDEGIYIATIKTKDQVYFEKFIVKQ